MLTVPWAAMTATQMLPPSLSDRASKLITLLFEEVEDQWKLRNEALHGRDRAEHSLSYIAPFSVPKLLVSTPTLELY
jgi:hypothetical protein